MFFNTFIEQKLFAIANRTKQGPQLLRSQTGQVDVGGALCLAVSRRAKSKALFPRCRCSAVPAIYKLKKGRLGAVKG